MAETPAGGESDSDDRSSDSMGPSSAGWASLVKDSPAAAWLPSLAATSPKDLLTWTGVSSSLAVPQQPPFEGACHGLPAACASYAQRRRSEDGKKSAADARQQKSDIVADGRSAGVAETNGLPDTHAQTDSLKSRARSHCQQAAVGSGLAPDHQEASPMSARVRTSSGVGEREKLRNQQDALVDAGLLSPASEVSSREKGNAPEPSIACPKYAEISGAAAASLPVAGQHLAGGLLDFGSPVVAAAVSPCNRSLPLLLFVLYTLLPFCWHTYLIKIAIRRAKLY